MQRYHNYFFESGLNEAEIKNKICKWLNKGITNDSANHIIRAILRDCPTSTSNKFMAIINAHIALNEEINEKDKITEAIKSFLSSEN